MVVDDEHPRPGARHTTPGRGQLEPDLGPVTDARTDHCFTAVAAHPVHDRLADAVAVGRGLLGVEAHTAVTDEHQRARRVDLHVHVDRVRAGVLRGIDHRLARRGEHRLQPGVDRAVPDLDDLDRHAVIRLHLADQLVERRADGARRRRRPAVQPRAQLTFLAAGQADDPARVVGAAPHEGQGVEHGVVEVGRDLGPLL